MKFKKKILVIATFVFFSCSIVGQENKIQAEDIERILGTWKGELTYVDYNSGNPYTMPCNVEIGNKKKHRKLSFGYEFPNEPKANYTGHLNFSKDGSRIDKKPIVSVLRNEEDSTTIVTEYAGKDGNDNNKANIRIFYLISNNSFGMRKEVKFIDTKEWKLRNEYSFIKDE